ncbi:MAG: radical SAM protein [Candidatus Buchananbacteria bacterium]|nr:radical SAM protein [Candidatus Buchananbacteria bacterium]
MILTSYNNLSLYIKRHFKTLMPFLTIKKALNALLALIEMKLKKTKCLSRPLVYRIEPCSLCNLRCVSCNTHKVQTQEKRLMDLADFKSMVDKIKPVALRTSLYDMGEPLLNRDIYKMIKYASDNKISTLISTNFNLFQKEHLAQLFDSRLTVLEPCLDGFTQENYVKYRVGGDVERVKQSLKDVMRYKYEHKAKYPIVDVQVVLFDHVKKELPLINKFLKDNRVDHITYRQENLGFNTAETGIDKNRPEQKNKTCFWLYLGMMIRPDGNVYPCCGRDFDRFSYGNILKQDLAEIWNNQYYQFSRKLFQKGPDLPYDPAMKDIPCLTCPEFQKQRKLQSPG